MKNILSGFSPMDSESTIYKGLVNSLPKTIEKVVFDGKDFPTWKFRFISVLMGYGLLDIVNGNADSSAKDYSIKRDYVYSMLVMSMTDSTIRFAMNAKAGDAESVWKNLHEEFERNTRFNKINLRRQLYECCGNKTLGIVELVGKIDLLCSRLESLKVTVTDEEKLAVLLSGAGSRFEAVVAVLELADESAPLQYSVAVSKLKDFDGKDISSRVADVSRNAYAVKKNKDDIICYFCQKRGHYRSDCPDLLKSAKEIRRVEARETHCW